MTLARRDWLLLAGIVGFAVGLPAVLGIMAGSIGIPHNDDFDYRRIALNLYSTGALALRGYSVMSLVGQILYVQPVLWLSGGETWAFAVATAILAIAGLASAYLLVRRVLPPAASAIAVLAVVVVPGFIVNTTTFMTDVPTFAASFACLAIGAAAIGPDGRIDWRRLIAALVVGCFGVSIREVAIAAPVAVVIVAAAADREGPRRGLVAGVALVVAAVAIHLLAGALPGQAVPVLDTAGGIGRLRAGYATLALCLAPALVIAIARWRSRWRVTDLLPGLALGFFLDWSSVTGLARTHRLPDLLLGNLFTIVGPSGVGGLAGSRPVLYPPQVWTAVEVATFVAMLLLPPVITGIVGTVVRDGGINRARLQRWARSPVSLMLAFAVLTAGGLAVYGYAFTLFDRYLWPLILVGSALLLVEPHPGPAATRLGVPGWLAGALLAGLAALSILNLLASDAFTAARWQYGEIAVASGIPRGDIDAGVEWVGYYATSPARPYAPPRRGQMWYAGYWPSFRQCAYVSSSPAPRVGYVELLGDPTAYRQFQLAGRELPLYLFRREAAGCP